MPAVYTIGHGHLDPTRFLAALRRHRIDTVVDVRSRPRPAYAPWAARQPLATRLEGAGLSYLDRGEVLGGEPEADRYYDETGRVRYDRLAATSAFRKAIAEVRERSRGGRVALLGAPADPTDAPRRRLVGRALVDAGVEVRHIRPDGSCLSERELRADRSEAGDQLELFGAGDERPWRSVTPVPRMSSAAGS